MKYRVLFGALTLALLSGCGGARIESGVDSEKTGEELDADEIEEICEATFDYGRETYTVDDRCGYPALRAALELYTDTLGEVPDSELQEVCEEEFDHCADEVAANENNDWCDDAPEQLEDCTSKVSEIEDCYADTLDAVADELRKLPSCEEVTGDKLSDFLADDKDLTPEVDSCNTIAQSCGDAYELADRF